MEEKEKRKDLSFGLKSAAHQNDTPSIDENTQHEYLNAATSAKCARWCSGGVVVWWFGGGGGVVVSVEEVVMAYHMSVQEGPVLLMDWVGFC